MIVLDTNVVSEIFRPQPALEVLAFLEQLDARGELAAVTAVTTAELLAGLARMPAGSRRSALSEKVELVIDRYAESGMVLPFAHSTAPHFARIVAMRAELKQPISVPDAMIAAICAEHQASCATRNVRDFSGTGIAFINPWESNASGV